MVSKARVITSHDTRAVNVISAHGRLLTAQTAWTAFEMPCHLNRKPIAFCFLIRLQICSHFVARTLS